MNNLQDYILYLRVALNQAESKAEMWRFIAQLSLAFYILIPVSIGVSLAVSPSFYQFTQEMKK